MNNFDKENLEALEAGFGFVPYERLKNEPQSHIAREKLRQSFIARGNPNPAAYGSVYLDEDAVLVINVVDNNAQLKKEIAEALKGMKYYLRDVTYPWSYLESVRDVVTAYMIQRPEGSLRDNFSSVCADDKYNTVIVELQNPTDEAIAAFKKTVIDSPAVTFRKSRGVIVPCATNIYCGSEVQEIDTAPPGYYNQSSVGYRVYKNTDQSIICAGHQFNSVGLGAYIGFNYVGMCYATSISTSPTSCDAAYVNISNSNYTPSNSTAFVNDTAKVIINTPAYGDTVYKVGQRTKRTTGIVTDSSVTSINLKDDNGVVIAQITDTIRAESPTGVAFVGQGDSGGLLYDCWSYTCGIATACNDDISSGPPVIGTVGYFSKAANIQGKFLCYRY